MAWQHTSLCCVIWFMWHHYHSWEDMLWHSPLSSYQEYPMVILFDVLLCTAFLHSISFLLTWYSYMRGWPAFRLLSVFNTLRPKQNGLRFPNDIFKRIFMNENIWISIEISLKFVPKGPINNIPALVQIMAWRRTGDKPLSEAMMA